MSKSPDAFRTISEVAEWLETPAHVLRFWESRFPQVKPLKRAGGRRYYRPADMQLLGGIKKLLHEDGVTIRGVQKILREKGVRHVSSLSPQIEGEAPVEAAAAPPPPEPPARRSATVTHLRPPTAGRTPTRAAPPEDEVEEAGFDPGNLPLHDAEQSPPIPDELMHAEDRGSLSREAAEPAAGSAEDDGRLDPQLATGEAAPPPADNPAEAVTSEDALWDEIAAEPRQGTSLPPESAADELAAEEALHADRVEREPTASGNETEAAPDAPADLFSHMGAEDGAARSAPVPADPSDDGVEPDRHPLAPRLREMAYRPLPPAARAGLLEAAQRLLALRERLDERLRK